MQEDGDGGVGGSLEQVQNLARAGPIGDIDGRMGGAGGLGGLTPALHHGRVVRHEDAVVVLGLEVDLALTRHAIIR